MVILREFLCLSVTMSIGSKLENALRVTFEFLNVVRLNVDHSEFRTHPLALVKLTLSTKSKASAG